MEYPKNSIRIPDSFQNDFERHFFLPWNLRSEDITTMLDSFPGKDLTYLEKYLNDDEWYAENKKQHKKWQRKKIVDNVNAEEFPNFFKKGITTKHTNIRRLPTLKPGFGVYSKAGEGFPFDYFQETAVWAGTPMMILHSTKDKQWYYVISPYYKGWVSMFDVAIANQEFIDQWKTGNYCLPLSDEVILHNENSNFALNGKIGMVLPYEKNSDDSDNVNLYYATSDERQEAKILKAEIEKKQVALDDFQMDEESLKLLVSNLNGRPYGWGGYLENRDCSALIRDLLSTYKIWLPRDSKDQINSGLKFDLPKDRVEKIQFIIEKGVPFLTILRMKGHNMLYVGKNIDEEPLIFHAKWGLKTLYSNSNFAAMLKNYPVEGIHEDEEGNLHGRHLIGESAITSVNVGKGFEDITIPLIDDIYSMAVILQTPK